MDAKTKISSIGEAAIMLKFTEEGYDVFASITGKSPFDKVVHKDGQLYRLEIKTTSQRSKRNTGWTVEIKRVRSNKKENKIYNFDSSASDILAIYIEPIKKIVVIWSKDVKCKSAMIIKDRDLESGKVAKWFTAPALKADGPKGPVSSNLTLSANLIEDGKVAERPKALPC